MSVGRRLRHDEADPLTVTRQSLAQASSGRGLSLTGLAYRVSRQHSARPGQEAGHGHPDSGRTSTDDTSYEKAESDDHARDHEVSNELTADGRMSLVGE